VGDWQTIGLAFLAFASFVALMMLLRIQHVIVPENERVVIFRFGRFQKVCGPGRVMFMRGVDEIKQTIDILDRPCEYHVPYIFLNGVPLSLTISMWSRYDPVEAAGIGQIRKRLLREMVQYTDDDRREQSQLLLREAVMRRAAEFNRQNPTVMKDSFFVKLMPVLPGQPATRQLLDRVRLDVLSAFRRLGIIINTQQPIMIRRLGLSDSVTIGMDWRRLTESLRESFPNMNDDTLAQIIGSIEGLDPLTIQRNTTEIQGLGKGAVTVGVGQGQPSTVILPQTPSEIPIAMPPTPPPQTTTPAGDEDTDDSAPEETAEREPEEKPAAPLRYPTGVPSEWSLLKSVPALEKKP